MGVIHVLKVEQGMGFDAQECLQHVRPGQCFSCSPVPCHRCCPVRRLRCDGVCGAERVAGARLVVDGMCGVGGNVVHFARRCAHAVGLDSCAPRLALAAHNAALYGVRRRLDLLCADFLQPLPRMQVWGYPTLKPRSGTFETP